MIKLIERKRNVAEVNTLSPLTWAYVGDSVFELLVRTHLTNTTKLKPHMLHIEAIKYVKADAQVKLLHKIEKELNDDDLGRGFYQRLKNVSPVKLIDFEDIGNNTDSSTAVDRNHSHLA